MKQLTVENKIHPFRGTKPASVVSQSVSQSAVAINDVCGPLWSVFCESQCCVVCVYVVLLHIAVSHSTALVILLSLYTGPREPSNHDFYLCLLVLLLPLLLLLGTIELHELQLVMRKLGQDPSEEDLIEMIASVDDNGDNEIDFNEFLILMKSRIGKRDQDEELREAFAVFDTDGSGAIDRKELKRLMKKLGQALTEAEIDAMMDEVDTNGDGEISFEEFKALMQN